jgi:hypothetical protein
MRDYNSYRGWDDPPISFWKYFFQENPSSGGISATLELISGTLVLLTWLVKLSLKKQTKKISNYKTEDFAANGDEEDLANPRDEDRDEEDFAATNKLLLSSVLIIVLFFSNFELSINSRIESWSINSGIELSTNKLL